MRPLAVSAIAALALPAGVAARGASRDPAALGGRRFSVVTNDDTGSDGFVFVSDLRGHTIWLPLPWAPDQAAISPSGRRIAVFDRQTRRLVVARLDVPLRRTRGMRTIAAFSGVTAITWSPGGRALAVAGTAGGRTGIWRVALSKRRPRYLGGPSEPDAAPGTMSWCRCGLLAFAPYLGSDTGILALPVPGGGSPRPLTTLSPEPHPDDPSWAPATDRQPVWSTDGRRLLWVRSPGESTIAPSDTPTPERVLTLDRVTRRQRTILTRPALSSGVIAWSPGGSSVAVEDLNDVVRLVSRGGRLERTFSLPAYGRQDLLAWRR